jgi:electron transport complex protein RnfD
MDKFITISASPHIHTDESVKKIMYRVVYALVPAFLISLYVFGLGALIVSAVAVISCVFFEYIIQKYLLKGEVTIMDGSAALTGLLLAFNLPTNLPIWIIIAGSFFTIAVAKMSFGGLGNNIFNPALAGRVFLLISFPVQMTSWPRPFDNIYAYADGVTGATPLGLIKEGLNNGEAISTLTAQIPKYTEMLYGFMGGSMGEVSALALLLGGGYMLYKHVISWHIPISILTTVAVFSGITWLVNPELYMDPLFHLTSGGLMIGAFFMATDMVTSPMTTRGMIVFGVAIGVLTMVIRLFGAYPEGISFAILIMNAFVPLLNKYFKPKRFGHNLIEKK